MSVTADILASWRAPRRVIRRQVAGPKREDRALAFLFLACLLIFVGQWPVAARRAALEPGAPPLEAQIGGALMGWIVIAPLVLYGLAALSRLIAGLFGGSGTWYTARVALFWSLLAVSPLWLLHGLVAGFIGTGPALDLVGGVLAVAFVVLWGAAMHETERRRPALSEQDDP